MTLSYKQWKDLQNNRLHMINKNFRPHRSLCQLKEHSSKHTGTCSTILSVNECALSNHKGFCAAETSRVSSAVIFKYVYNLSGDFFTILDESPLCLFIFLWQPNQVYFCCMSGKYLIKPVSGNILSFQSTSIIHSSINPSTHQPIHPYIFLQAATLL